MKILEFFSEDQVSVSRWEWVHRCWAVFALVLILGTWPLWTPQQVFPQVPLVAAAGRLPAGFQWASLAAALLALVVSFLLTVVPNRSSRPLSGLRVGALTVFSVAMAGLILTDQHRLQPWAYQLLIYAMLLAGLSSSPADRRCGIGLLRMIMLSIYVYSALGKLDHQFVHTVGQQFLGVLGGWVGVDIEQLPRFVRLLLAALFPLGELAVAIALAVPKLRRMGVVGAVLLHVSLLVILGPWGLDHESGVLLWNAFFIVQAILLFAGSGRSVESSDETDVRDPLPRRWVAIGTTIIVVGMPLLEPLGWWDHWLAWGLYSPRNSRVVVEIHRAGLRRLPARMQPYLALDEANGNWVPLEIDHWSLRALSVPIYPQDRFQVGVSEAVAIDFGLERSIRIHVLSMSHRLTGGRQVETLTGREQIVAAGRRFRLNSHPAN